MNKVIKALLTVLIPVLLMLVLPLNAGAVGLAVGPSELEIADALSGEDYQQMIFVKYTGGGECLLQLSATGDISDWVSFYDPSDLITPVESVTASPGEWTYITVMFKIPEDAPTGNATGTVYVQTAPLEEDTGDGAAVNLQGKVDVTIHILGTAEEEGTAGGMSTGLIIGIIIAAIVGVAGVAGVVMIIRRRLA